MDKSQISALLVLKGLGIDTRMHSFDDRLAVQKSVYLVQAAGIHLGHHFSWYLRGPYSPSLTRDVYTANENHDVEVVLTSWKLDSATIDKLEKLRSHFSPPSDELRQPEWLELLASTHFLIDRGQVRGEPVAKAVRLKLEKFDKHFTQTQVESGLGTLRDLNLLPTPA